MAALTFERLKTLLRMAEHAHGVYEGTLGHRDEDWPNWYARYLIGQLETPSEDAPGLLPVTLTGRYVQLRPLSLEDVEALSAVGLDAELWRFTVTQIATRADLERYIRTALQEQAAGRSVPFVIVSKTDGVVVGSTRYGNIDRHNRRVEIGWTWVAPRWQRTPVNTEAKLLLLRHAFENLGCVRVEFKTDRLNEKSRMALRRIGAIEEGILRHHLLTQGGRFRDSVYYSILAAEWPAVQDALEQRLLGSRTAP